MRGIVGRVCALAVLVTLGGWTPGVVGGASADSGVTAIVTDDDPAGSYVCDAAAGCRVTVTHYGASYQFAGMYSNVTLTAPAGTSLAPGDIPISGYGGSGVTLVEWPTSCSGATGDLQLNTFTTDPVTGDPQVVDASWWEQCPGRSDRIFGEIRYNAARGYRASWLSGDASFGETVLGTDTPQHTFTLRAVSGSEPLTIGAAVVVGPDADEFSVDSDACDGVDLASTQSCTITVSGHAARDGWQTAELLVPDGTARGYRELGVGLQGTTVPGAPDSVTTETAADGVAVTWKAPTDTGGTPVTSYEVFRGSAPDALHSVGTVTGWRYADTSVQTGATYYYSIRAINDVGAGPLSAAVSGTAPDQVTGPGPLDVLTVEATLDTYIGRGHAYVFDASRGATLNFGGWQNGFSLVGSSTNGSRADVQASPPTGQRFEVGHYDLAQWSDSSHAMFFLDVDYAGACSAGTLDVSQAVYAADGSMRRFAARFVVCNGRDAGEIRWQSDLPYSAVDASSGPDPATPLRSAGPTTVTVTNTGMTALSLGDATVTPEDSDASWTVDNDSNACSGTTLAAGESCNVTVQMTPATKGPHTAQFRIATDTALGMRVLRLSGYGQSVPAQVSIYAESTVTGVHLEWTPVNEPNNPPVTSYVVFRDSGHGLQQIATTTSTSYDDTVGPGDYKYAVAAVNELGAGPTYLVSQHVAPDLLVFATDNGSGYPYDLDLLASTGGIPSTWRHDGSDHATPAVSPDGTQVAYASDSGDAAGTYHLWVAPLDGSAAPRQLTTGSADDLAPAWSPDGSALAFERWDDAAQDFAVWTVPLHGGNASAVPGGAHAAAPSWLPDARRIAVTDTADSGGIDLLTLDTGARSQIQGSVGLAEAQVSPDGARIVAVRSSSTSDLTRIAVLAVTGGTPTDYPCPYGYNSHPVWASDGVIDFVSAATPTGLAHLWQTTSTGLIQLTSGASDDEQPAVVAARADVTAPAAPSGVVATGADGAITVVWATSAERDVNHYEASIRRSGSTGGAIATWSGFASSASFPGLTNGVTYSVSVVAVDGAGNRSAAADVSATPLRLSPPAPTSLAADVDAVTSTLHLTWAYTDAPDQEPARSFTVLVGGTPVLANLSPSARSAQVVISKPTRGTVVVQAVGADASSASAPAGPLDFPGVDSTAPVLTVTQQPPPVTTVRNVTVSASVQDPDSPDVTLSCTLDGNPVACSTGADGASVTVPLYVSQDGRHTLVVAAADQAGNRATVSSRWLLDTAAPSVAVRSLAPFALSQATLGWAGADTGSGVAGYDVRYRRAMYNTSFGVWRYPSSWQGIANTSIVVSPDIGYTYCYSLRAHDAAGLTSPWSAPACVAGIADDHSLSVSKSSTRQYGSRYFDGTVTATSHNGVLSIRVARTGRLALVATTCPSCGAVAVRVNGVVVANVRLYSRVTRNQRIIMLPLSSPRSGVVSVTVTSRQRALVDGFGALRI